MTVVACLVVLGSAFVRAATARRVDHDEHQDLADDHRRREHKDLNVDTVNGVVTLHGKVATEAEKTKAGQVAAKSMASRT